MILVNAITLVILIAALACLVLAVLTTVHQERQYRHDRKLMNDVEGENP
jgi:hypothetical protein